MSSSSDFFKELTEFLPKRVSPFKSYMHASIVFVIVFSIIHTLSSKFQYKEDETEKEQKARKIVSISLALIVGIFISEAAFKTSWSLANRKANGNHIIYQRWFPKLYSN